MAKFQAKQTWADLLSNTRHSRFLSVLKVYWYKQNWSIFSSVQVLHLLPPFVPWLGVNSPGFQNPMYRVFFGGRESVCKTFFFFDGLGLCFIAAEEPQVCSTFPSVYGASAKNVNTVLIIELLSACCTHLLAYLSASLCETCYVLRRMVCILCYG